MTFPGADTSRTSDNMALGNPERENGRSPDFKDLRKCLVQVHHYNKKRLLPLALAMCSKGSAVQQLVK